MSSTSVAEGLVDMTSAISADTLSQAARDAVVRNSTQIFGVARLGLQNPLVRSTVGYVAQYESGSSATIVGNGDRTGTPAGAAFANAVASHGDFREDTHAESSSHPGVVVMPAALAAAELQSAPLPDGRYLEAVVAGHEVIGRLGKVTALRTIERGFRAPSVYTVFGGALAAGQVLGLTLDEQVHALAIAAQGASGINHPFLAGTDEWFLAPALAARHAVTSALLAANGVRGSRHVLEGEDGVFAAFAGGTAEVDLSPVGERPYEVQRARLKAALTCGWNQSLVHQLNTLDLDPRRVERLLIRMSSIAGEYPGVARTKGFVRRSEALLSAPYAAALQLVHGSLDHDGYAVLDAPDILAVAERVEVTTDDRLEGYATALEVHLTNGDVIASHDGNDPPGFALDTQAKVLKNLRRITASAGQDAAAVDALAAGVTSLVSTGDPGPLAEELGQPLS